MFNVGRSREVLGGGGVARKLSCRGKCYAKTVAFNFRRPFHPDCIGRSEVGSTGNTVELEEKKGRRSVHAAKNNA